MVLLLSCVAGVTTTTGAPLTSRCSTEVETTVASSVAMSWKLPGDSAASEIGSLKVMSSCAFGATLLALFSGKRETTCGGVASSFTRGMVTVPSVPSAMV
jgi:hypothetical protein